MAEDTEYDTSDFDLITMANTQLNTPTGIVNSSATMDQPQSRHNYNHSMNIYTGEIGPYTDCYLPSNNNNNSVEFNGMQVAPQVNRNTTFNHDRCMHKQRRDNGANTESKLQPSHHRSCNNNESNTTSYPLVKRHKKDITQHEKHNHRYTQPTHGYNQLDRDATMESCRGKKCKGILKSKLKKDLKLENPLSDVSYPESQYLDVSSRDYIYNNTQANRDYEDPISINNCTSPTNCKTYRQDHEYSKQPQVTKQNVDEYGCGDTTTKLPIHSISKQNFNDVKYPSRKFKDQNILDENSDISESNPNNINNNMNLDCTSTPNTKSDFVDHSRGNYYDMKNKHCKAYTHSINMDKHGIASNKFANHSSLPRCSKKNVSPLIKIRKQFTDDYIKPHTNEYSRNDHYKTQHHYNNYTNSDESSRFSEISNSSSTVIEVNPEINVTFSNGIHKRSMKHNSRAGQLKSTGAHLVNNEDSIESDSYLSGNYSDLMFTKDNQWKNKNNQPHVDYSLFRNSSGTSLSAGNNEKQNNDNKIMRNRIQKRFKKRPRNNTGDWYEDGINSTKFARKNNHYFADRKYMSNNNSIIDRRNYHNFNNGTKSASKQYLSTSDNCEDSVIDVNEIVFHKKNASETLRESRSKETCHNNEYTTLNIDARESNRSKTRNDHINGFGNRKQGNMICNDISPSLITDDTESIMSPEEIKRNDEIRQHNNAVIRIKEIIKRVKSTTEANSHNTPCTNYLNNDNNFNEPEKESHKDSYTSNISNCVNKNAILNIDPISTCKDIIRLQSSDSIKVDGNTWKGDVSNSTPLRNSTSDTHKVLTSLIAKAQGHNNTDNANQRSTLIEQLPKSPNSQIVEKLSNQSSQLSNGINKCETLLSENQKSQILESQLTNTSNNNCKLDTTGSVVDSSHVTLCNNVIDNPVISSTSKINSTVSNNVPCSVERRASPKTTPIVTYSTASNVADVQSSDLGIAHTGSPHQHMQTRQPRHTNTIATNTSNTSLFRKPPSTVPRQTSAQHNGTQTSTVSQPTATAVGSLKTSFDFGTSDTAVISQQIRERLHANTKHNMQHSPVLSTSGNYNDVHRNTQPFNQFRSSNKPIHLTENSIYQTKPTSIINQSNILQPSPTKYESPKPFSWTHPSKSTHSHCESKNHNNNSSSNNNNNNDYANSLFRSNVNPEIHSDNHKRKGFLDIPNKNDMAKVASRFTKPQNDFKSLNKLFSRAEYERAPEYSTSEYSSCECCRDDSSMVCNTNCINNNNNNNSEPYIHEIPDKEKPRKTATKKVKKKTMPISKKTAIKKMKEYDSPTSMDNILTTDTFHFIPKSMQQDSCVSYKTPEKEFSFCKTCKCQTDECQCTCTQQ